MCHKLQTIDSFDATKFASSAADLGSFTRTFQQGVTFCQLTANLSSFDDSAVPLVNKQPTLTVFKVPFNKVSKCYENCQDPPFSEKTKKCQGRVCSCIDDDLLHLLYNGRYSLVWSVVE